MHYHVLPQKLLNCPCSRKGGLATATRRCITPPGRLHSLGSNKALQDVHDSSRHVCCCLAPADVGDSTQATAGAPPLQQLFAGGARVVEAAKAAWSSALTPGDTVVDATCGNGHDTLELARLVGPSGCVVALDIQADAVESTRQRLQQELPAHLTPELHLLHVCHSQMQSALAAHRLRAPKLVCFNLGWLPSSGRKDVITTPGTTLRALQQAHALVAEGGFVCVIAYTGHAGGMAEYEGVRDYMAELDSYSWVSTETHLLNRESAPRLLLSHRLPGKCSSAQWRPVLALVKGADIGPVYEN